MEVEVICISSDDEPNLPKKREKKCFEAFVALSGLQPKSKDKTDKILTNSTDDSIEALVPQDVFSSFITLCLQKCPEHDQMDMDKIVDKLKRRYENLDSTYAKSKDFFLFLNEKREAVISDHKKIYIHILEIMNKMKKNIKKKSQALQNNEIYDAVPSTSYTNNASVCNRVESDNDEDDEDSDSEKRRRIHKVLSTMKKCEAVIKRLEKEEVDFDDENSTYIKVGKYKQRMVDLYNKLCELTGENADAGYVYLRPKRLNITQIISLDQAITNFINSKINRLQNRIRKKECLINDLIFPDYRDILECINKCNKNENLGLDEGKQKQIAEKAFKKLGEHLQRIRRHDYWNTFSMYLENTEDPVTRDKNLARKLSDNRTEGEKRLAAIFEKYTQKQLEIKNQDNEETTSEEEDKDDDVDEKKQIDVIDDKNKNNQNLCTTSERSDNVDINKTIKENRLSMEKNKSDISMTNVHHIMAKAMSNKIVADSVQEKCNKTVKIKLVSDLAVSKNEDKTINENMTHESCTSNITNDMQKNSPTGSKTNCTKDLTKVEALEISKAVTNSEAEKVTKDVEDIVTQITSEFPVATVKLHLILSLNKDLTKVEALEISKAVTNSEAEKVTKDVEDTVTQITSELITENIVEDIPEYTAELVTEDTTELITKDITVTANTVEVMTDEIKITKCDRRSKRCTI